MILFDVEVEFFFRIFNYVCVNELWLEVWGVFWRVWLMEDLGLLLMVLLFEDWEFLGDVIWWMWLFFLCVILLIIFLRNFFWLLVLFFGEGVFVGVSVGVRVLFLFLFLFFDIKFLIELFCCFFRILVSVLFLGFVYGEGLGENWLLFLFWWMFVLVVSGWFGDINWME